MRKIILGAAVVALTAGQALLMPDAALASAPAVATLKVQQAQNPAGGDLQVTIGLTPYSGDPAECGSSTDLEVNVGDQVNVCYTLTNNGADTLAFQSLTDSIDGAILTFAPISIAPGESHPYVRTVIASTDTDRSASWSGYVNLANYAYDDTVASNFIDISATGTDVGFPAGDGFDNEIVEYTADFPVRFYGRTSTALCLSNDGLIQYDDATCIPPQGQQPPPGYSYNQDIPSTYGTEVPTYLAPFWNNLGDGPGAVYVETLGTAPDRQLIVQWNDLYHYAISTATATFEVVFEENSDTIRYEYLTTAFGNFADNGGAATVGMQADPNGLFTKYSYYQPSLRPDSAIQWNYTAPVSYSADSAAATIDVGLPKIAIPTNSIDATVALDETATGTLTIGNTGDRDLNWNLSQAPGGPAAHFPKVQRYAKPATDHAPLSGSVSQSLARQALNKQAPGSLPTLAPHAPYSIGGDFAVPAYGVSLLKPGMVGFDALDPAGTYTQINESYDTIYSGTFIGNDFTKLYVIVNDSWEIPPGTYGTLDVATGEFTSIGMLTGVPQYSWWDGMAQDPLTGTVYALNFNDNSFSDAAATLYTLNLDNGRATMIGAVDGPGVNPVHFIAGIAISPAGLMYGIDLYGQQLLAIDKTTGAASVIASLGLDVQYVQDIAFDQQSGALYWAAFYNDELGTPVSEMRVIDPLTATSQPIGLLPPAGPYPYEELGALAIATPSIGCAAPGSVPWLSFDSTSGIVAAGGADQDITVRFDSTSLDAGVYQATICVQSDDQQHPTVAVPVTLTVSQCTSDAVFSNGFDDGSGTCTGPAGVRD